MVGWGQIVRGPSMAYGGDCSLVGIVGNNWFWQ